ncbi:hypothetical protein BASA50_004198 [Batrachochytrium salamandrivorans]|uniref:Uncharacterized protein n=1 Tax=Batrachochytrium salamandrivorans TaxID=1357716 RepID=A0ABQ8FGC8_9FUNG|nr:hypothetical protein BASA62_009401 [Batrachochytrium salamandrivorans]KAH6597854.1 hypothetical protein BASA50_004198 [Batrachochytrium salamandrivorans]KAH6598797.1 hypothetical protein BASA61_002783 [Batrachochytrium salamandrivorans]KAH9269373.1 hypothetical protein BASA83_008599 [Batrachochytrium salamandrivorans]
MRIIRAAVAPSARPAFFQVTWKTYLLVGIVSVFVGNYSFAPYIGPYFGETSPTSEDTIKKMQQYLLGTVPSASSTDSNGKTN